jgi:hypothetical protein
MEVRKGRGRDNGSMIKGLLCFDLVYLPIRKMYFVAFTAKERFWKVLKWVVPNHRQTQTSTSFPRKCSLFFSHLHHPLPIHLFLSFFSLISFPRSSSTDLYYTTYLTTPQPQRASVYSPSHVLSLAAPSLLSPNPFLSLLLPPLPLLWPWIKELELNESNDQYNVRHK